MFLQKSTQKQRFDVYPTLDANSSQLDLVRNKTQSKANKTVKKKQSTRLKIADSTRWPEVMERTAHRAAPPALSYIDCLTQFHMI